MGCLLKLIFYPIIIFVAVFIRLGKFIIKSIKDYDYDYEHYTKKYKDIKRFYTPYEEYCNAYTKNKAKTYPKNYVVFDTETTGLEPSYDYIIEISAIKVIDGKIVDTFSELINPQMYVDKFITDLTGINNKMLEDKPTIDKVIPRFFNFIEDYTLIGHNVPYDIKMLASECYRNNIELCENKLINTVTIAKKIIPKGTVKNYKLSTLKDFFGIELSSHRGLVDCLTCNYVYMVYLEFSKIISLHKRVIKIDDEVVIVNDETGEVHDLNIEKP